eukprot:1156278-Pelagomonas_calceolata.AAC.3
MTVKLESQSLPSDEPRGLLQDPVFLSGHAPSFRVATQMHVREDTNACQDARMHVKRRYKCMTREDTNA